MGRAEPGTGAPAWWSSDAPDASLTGWDLPLWDGAPAGRPNRLRIPPRLAVWRSPSDQPRWARPMLLGVAGLAALAYAWAISSQPLETFYAYATKSMALNWRNFFFGAVDPWGTVTTDKLPGSLWVDALSVRIFGFHLWSVALPQVVAGALTILVLYRAVRRLAGPVAGLAAAAVLAASPATVLLNRGNIPDSLMILLVVLAADATSAAIVSGDRRHLLWAAVWVGLAFQAKMLDAWLLLPALFLAYLVSGVEAPARRRLANCVGAGMLAVVVSLSWMVVVTLVPSSHRPYFDGSGDNSVFTQVFVYNGLDRFRGLAHLDRALGPSAPFLRTFTLHDTHSASVVAASVQPGIGRLLTGWFARDGGWLLPLAALALVVLLVVLRRDRRHPVYGGVVLWGTWLVLEFAFLSAGTALRSYYMASIMPAVAALVGIGISVALPKIRERGAVRVLVALCVIGTACYAAYVLPGSAAERGWLVPLVLVLAVVSAALLLVPRLSARVRSAGAAVGFAAILLTPTVAVVAVTASGLGPFDAPFEPAAVTHDSVVYRVTFARQNTLIGRDVPFAYPADRALQAVDTSDYAAGLGMDVDAEVLPIGGFAGAVPSPTLAQLVHDVRAGRVGAVLVPIRPRSPDPRMQWVIRHCQRLGTEGTHPVLFYNYVCTPALRAAPATAPTPAVVAPGGGSAADGIGSATTP